MNTVGVDDAEPQEVARPGSTPGESGSAPGASPAGRWWGHPLREYGWPIEFAALLADPVWRGEGVADGEGRPVLLIPGFMAGDASLGTMARWLRRRGYRADVSGIRWNVGCADRILDGLHTRLDRLHERTGQPVAVVGHSRGGLLGNALAGLRPERVSQVITLGSPLADNNDISVLTNLAVTGARRLEYGLHPESRQRGCFTSACDCSYARGVAAQQSRAVPLTCVLTPDDGIVAPSACSLPGARTIQVRGGHIALAWNAQVYRVLAQELARSRSPVTTTSPRPT